MNQQEITKNILFNKLKWYLLIRIAIVLSLLGSTITFQLFDQLHKLGRSLNFLIALVVLTMAVTIASAIALKKIGVKKLMPYAYLQLGYDLLFATALIYITGGSESAFSFMYYLTIILGGILLYQQAAYLVASLAAILYGALLISEFYQLFPPLFDKTLANSQLTAANFFVHYGINLVVFYIVAYVTSYLVSRLHQTEDELAIKTSKLVESEQLKENIVHSIDTGILTLDDGNYITTANVEAARVLSVTADELIGRHISQVKGNLEGLISREEEMIEIEVGKDDSHLHLACRVSGLFNLEGKREGYMILLRDITELKEIQEKMQRQEKLAAVGQLAAGMAHEIRNPLASMSGSIELLKEQNFATLENKKLMNIVLRETRRLDGLINDFLNFARPRPLKKEVLSLDAEVCDTLDLLSTSAESDKSIRLNNDLEKDVLIVGDSSQIKQVAWNLLKNAFESIVEEGVINVELKKNEQQAILIISDNGQGINLQQLPHVFDPFFTTKSGGTGLGLATVYRILEEHGADIDLKSNEGKGTDVKVSFPLYNQ